MIVAPGEWVNYAVYYPDEDDENYDGIHSGGLKGVREDAPEYIKRQCEEYMRESARERERATKSWRKNVDRVKHP